MTDILKYFSDVQHRNKRIYERAGNYLSYLKCPSKIYYKHRAKNEAERICSTPEIQAIAKDISSYEGEYKKYIDFNRYIIMNLRRIYELKLHTQHSLDILDIGCGAGFFSFLAGQYGHNPQGLDLPTVEIFNILTQKLGVPRWECKIEPRKKIKFGETKKFDLIVAYAICFHHVGGKPWSADEWEFFLNDIKINFAKPGARMHLWFNNDPHGDFDDVKRKLLVQDEIDLKFSHKTVDITFE